MRGNHACDNIIQVMGDGGLCQGMAFNIDPKLWRLEVRDVTLGKHVTLRKRENYNPFRRCPIVTTFHYFCKSL